MANTNQQITKIALHKTADVYMDNSEKANHIAKSFKSLLESLAYTEVNNILSVTWRIVFNAPVSVERQNKRYLKKATQIAKALGRSVEAFDQLNDITYGVAIV